MKLQQRHLPLILMLTAIMAWVLLWQSTQQHQRQLQVEKEQVFLTKIKDQFVTIIQRELETYVVTGQTSFFSYPITINTKSGVFSPPHLGDLLASEQNMELRKFDLNSFDDLKKIARQGDDKTILTLFPLLLNSRIDQFIHEKAVLYLYLIRIKLQNNLTIIEESRHFRKLVSGIKSVRESLFLKNQFNLLLNNYQNKPAFFQSFADFFPQNKNESADLYYLDLARRLSAKNQMALVTPEFDVITKEENPLLIVMLQGDNQNRAATFLELAPLNKKLNIQGVTLLFSETPPTSKIKWEIAPNFYIITNEAASPIIDGTNFMLFLPLLILGVYIVYTTLQITHARQLNEKMAVFVSSISHQLRTPLSSTILYQEVADQHFAKGNLEKARTALAASSAQAQALGTLFENYTTLHRIFTDEFSLSPENCQLDELLSAFFQNYQHEIDQEKLEVEWTIPKETVVFTDRWALLNILANLLSNSLKYAKRHRAFFTISMADTIKDDFIHLLIADAGVGIPRAEQSQIFQRFFIGESGKTSSRSTGLGLHIAASLAEKNGGTLSLFHSDGEGTIFKLVLPKGNNS